MRIIHAISTLAGKAGGPPVAVMAMARAAAALGHDTVIHATDHGMTAEELRAAPEASSDRVRVVVHRHIPPGGLTRHASLGLWRALAREVGQSDVVHLHSLYMFQDWAVWRECRRAGVPYILRPAGSLDPFIVRRHRWRKLPAELLFQNRVTRDAALIHFTSESEQELAQPFIFGRPGAIVPLGVDVERFAVASAAPFRARFPETQGRRIVLFAGRLNFKKGIEILIPAFAEAAARHEDALLVLAGPDGGFAARARALVEEHGIAGRTLFTGHLDGELLAAVYAAADLFVLPSRTENFALAAAEAMAAGVPSLLSAEVQIATEAAKQGACRLVARTIADWAKAIDALLEDPEAARLLKERARSHARRTYGWEAIGPRLIAMYQEAIEASRRSD